MVSGVVAIMLVAVVAFAVVSLTRSPATTTNSTSTTSTAAGSSTTAPSWVAVWPTARSLRYATPTAAALGFANEVLRMRSPVAESFQRGDTRSGEVPIRSTPHGPVTTVLVRQLTGDRSWWVLGATCAAVDVARPRALATVSSPFTLSGRSTSFEAVINFALYQDDATKPLVTGVTTGGANGVMGPFARALYFEPPTHHYGVLVVSVRSPKDGAVLEASTVRVAFRHR